MKFPNHLTLITLAGAMVAAGAYAVSQPVLSFMKAPAVSIPLPADSAARTKLSTEKMLDAKKAADWFRRYETQDWTTVLPQTVEGDSVQRVSLAPASGSQAQLNTFTSRLRAARYAKGALKLSLNTPAELFVNGVSKIRHTATDGKMADKSADIELQPEEINDIELHLLSLPEGKGTPMFSLEFVPAKDFENVEIASGAETTRRFSYNTICLGEQVSRTSLSPDGKYILIYYTTVYGEGDTRSNAQLREVASNRIISASLPSQAKWMPEGAQLFYTEKSSAGTYTLCTTSPTDLSRRVVADGLPVQASDMIWLPDAKSFLYYKAQDPKKHEGVMRRYSSPDDRIPGSQDYYDIMLYNVKDATAIPLLQPDCSTSLTDISPDGRRALFLSSRETPSQFPFYDRNIFEMDLSTQRIDTIVAHGGEVTSASYSPDAKSVLITGGPNAFDGIGRNAGSFEWANDFDTQMFILNLADRKVRAITRDFNPAVEGSPVWNRADGKIYFRGEDGFYMRLYSLDPASLKVKEIPTSADYVRAFSMADRSARYIAYTGMGYTYNGGAWLVDLKSGKSTLLADPKAQEFKGMNFGAEQPWTFTAKSGTVVDGTLTLPPDFDPSKKYPLIVYYYGGTSPSARRSDHPYTPQLFASRDYIVYVLNPSGTTGYGQEYSARHVNAWGEPTADEIIEGVKELCKAYPQIDDKKIGCLGASYGGFMTQYLLTKTDIFAAAVSHAGISNVTSYWGEGYWGYTYDAVAAARSYPWNNPDLFTKHGSLFNADKIHTPLLLLHGNQDTNVPMGESVQLFNALKILGREVEFITVDGQDHVITDINKRRIWHATIMAWFAKWLQDDPRWWDSMYGK